MQHTRSFPWPRRVLLGAALAAAFCASTAALAQPPATARLEGRTLDGRPFQLDSQRGKVVMVIFWSTGCAVCRDTMPELRANYAGWQGRPFELVTVATDARRQDVVDYEALLESTRPMGAGFPRLWRQEPGHGDGFGPTPQLPAAFVIDTQGRIVERYTGRIPPAAWDRVAELLP